MLAVTGLTLDDSSRFLSLLRTRRIVIRVPVLPTILFSLLILARRCVEGERSRRSRKTRSALSSSFELGSVFFFVFLRETKSLFSTLRALPSLSQMLSFQLFELVRLYVRLPVSGSNNPAQQLLRLDYLFVAFLFPSFFPPNCSASLDSLRPFFPSFLQHREARTHKSTQDGLGNKTAEPPMLSR